MHIVAIGWLFVVVLAAAAEATSPQGSLLGALLTLLGWGLLPLSIVLYILGTPGRKAALRQREAIDAAAADAPATADPDGSVRQASAQRGDSATDAARLTDDTLSSARHHGDGSGQAPRSAVAPVREEP